MRLGIDVNSDSLSCDIFRRSARFRGYLGRDTMHDYGGHLDMVPDVFFIELDHFGHTTTYIMPFGKDQGRNRAVFDLLVSGCFFRPESDFLVSTKN